MYRLVLGTLSILAMGVSGCDSPVVDTATGTTTQQNKRSHSALKIPERRTIGVPDSGVELGMGWDSQRGEIVPNNCLEFAAVRSTGQTIDMDLSEVSDQSEMMEKMNVSAEVSVKSMFASGSAKTDFAKSSKMTSDTTTLLLRTTVENGVLMIAPPNSHAPTRDAFPAVEPVSLPAGQVLANDISQNDRRAREARSGAIGFKPEVKKLVGKPEAFRNQCGDYFVATIYSGAEMFTTYSFSSTSREQKSKVSAAVKGSVGMYSGSVSGGKENASAMSNTNMSMRFVQVGGGANMIPMSKEGLEKKLEQLAIEADLTPRFHTMEIRSYREIPEAKSLIYGSNEDEFEVVADYYWFLSTLSDDIDDVLENPDRYYARTGLSADALVNLQDEIIEVRRGLAEIIDAYMDERIPDPETLDAINHQWFPNDAKKAFVIDFDLDAIFNSDDKQDDNGETEIDPCLSDGWFHCVIDEVRHSVPNENPNTLNLLLPLPRNAYGMTVQAEGSAQCVKALMAIAFIKPKGKAQELCAAMAVERNGKADLLDTLSLDEFKTFVLDHKIARQSKRVCTREPRDNECMTHAEIAKLAELIPVPEK